MNSRKQLERFLYVVANNTIVSVVKKIRRIANPKPEVVIQHVKPRCFIGVRRRLVFPSHAKSRQACYPSLPKKGKVDERFACIPIEQRENTSLRKAYGQN
jgi:hypothetical protein